MKEEWKKVCFDGLDYYEVSNFGNVRLLPRDVRTHVKNHGKDMYVIAHRKGRDIKVQLDDGRTIVRMMTPEGIRRKFSLGYLVLRLFDLDSCPGDVNYYTAGYIDNDVTNNRLDNLMWVSKATLMKNVASVGKGESREDLLKYKNIVVKAYGIIVGYAETISDCVELFNSYGFNTSVPAVTRAYKSLERFFYLFDLCSVSDEEFNKILLNTKQMNLKDLYDIIMMDRRSRGLTTRSLHEETKEEKKKLVNNSKTDNKKTKKQEVKTRETKTRLDDIDDREFYEEEKKKKEEFMSKLMEAINKNK